jgi:hypothetical protein
LENRRAEEVLPGEVSTRRRGKEMGERGRERAWKCDYSANTVHTSM